MSNLIDFITDKKLFSTHKSSVQSDPSIIRMMGPETFCENGDKDHHLIHVYTYGVPQPRDVLAFDSSGYNLGEQLPSNDEFELCELQTEKGRLWVNSKAVIDCIPVEEVPKGKAQTKLIFEEGMSYIVPGVVDEVRKALKCPVDIRFSFTPPPEQIQEASVPETPAPEAASDPSPKPKARSKANEQKKIAGQRTRTSSKKNVPA